MPIYEYKCKCGYSGDHIARPEADTLPCEKCRRKMVRQFHPQFGIIMGVGAYGRYDENLGVYVRTNSHHREIMKDQGVEPKIGKGWY